MSETTDLHLPDTLHIEGDVHEAPQPDGERKLTPREEMMARIAAHAEEERHKEIALGSTYDAEARERGEALPPPDGEEEDPEPLEATLEPAHKPEPVAATPEPPPAPVAPQVRTLNLNGQFVQVTDAQFEQLAQMGALAGMALAQQPVAPHPEPPPAPAPVALDDGKVREAVQRIQFGSPDEGAAALGGLIHDVLARVPAPAIDHNTLVQQASQRAVQELHGQQVTAAIKSEYPQIFTDSGLMALAQDRVRQIEQRDAATGQRRHAIEIYREAGNQVYDLLKLPRPGSEPTQTAPQAAPTVQLRAGVEERKRAAPRTTQPVDRRSAMPPQAPQAPSGSAIVAWIAKQRGQSAPV